MEELLDLSPASLDALVLRVQQGDREAFTRLFHAVHREARVFLSVRAPSLELVDEVLQAAFVECWRQIGKYEPRGTFLSWFKGIARNLLLMELREQARLAKVEGRRLDEVAARAALERPDEPDARLGRLQGCVDRLPPHSRDLIRRRYEERAENPDIALKLGRSEAWVATTLCRIREALRDCLGREEVAL